MLNRGHVRKTVIEGLPLFIILFGVALVAFSLGPYQNWDTDLEFEAASNIVKIGSPYVESYGTAIDQPPLGFYIQALFFTVFGSSNTGVTVVTFFGLGSVALMYLIGRELYGKSAGLIAAALLGLSPWHLVLSRSFLMDAQCLFFSLLCLLVGVLAIRKGSVKLTSVAGLVFAAAILTKFYAAFVLVPLLLFYINSRPKEPKRILSQLAAFSLPLVVFSVFWYQIILGRTLMSAFVHNDFTYLVPANIVPSPFFVTNFLMDYGLGLFFMAATAFALLLGLSPTKYFPKIRSTDLICLASIIFVLSINVVLGAVMARNVPYFSAVKYDYQALPYFALLAASLIAKGASLLNASKSTLHRKKQLIVLVAVAAVALLVASVVSSMYYTNALSTRDYLQYRVEPQVDYGYALLNPTPLTVDSALMVLQYLGFAVVLSGVLFGFRQEMLGFGRVLKGFISTGHRMVNTVSTAENMIDQTSPKPTGLRAFFDKYRVAFLVFAGAYGVILLLSLMHYPMEWDEVVHLNGALNLLSRDFDAYVNTAFYPPLFDSVTAVSYNVFGVSLFSARLVPALFSVLSLWVVFELARSMYGGKAGLLSAVLLAIMPGYFWLSRMALLETMLLFFFVLALLFFFRWLQNKQDRYVFFGGLAIGLGILTKYQMVVAFLVIAVSILFLARGQLKHAFSRFTLLIAMAAAVVTPWIVAAYQVYASKLFEEWLYALQVGNPNKLEYSGRYPTPIFYLIEMVWPYDLIHPISIFLYAAGLAGLVFLALRHNKGDKYVLIWFACTFAFFTLITNKEWRYVLPLFPVLAIAAAVLILFSYGKLDAWRKQAHISRQRQRKLVAGLFVVVVAGAAAYSVYDAYAVTSYFDVAIELEPATVYAMNRMENNQTIMVLITIQLFQPRHDKLLPRQKRQHPNPNQPIPHAARRHLHPQLQHNRTHRAVQAKQRQVPVHLRKRRHPTYYNTTLNLVQVYEEIYASGNFSGWTDEASFGSNPRRIIVLTFLG